MRMRRIFRGGRVNDAGRLPRYLLITVLPLVLLWAAVLSYLALGPRSYASTFSLVLPGSGASTSVNLDSIGQASSAASSPYASSRLSPTANYQRLMSSSRVLTAAAAATDMPVDNFPIPRIKLVDQTNFIEVRITEGTPKAAHHCAEALLQAFLDTLDDLRADEVTRREQAYRAGLDSHRTALRDARQRKLALQADTGLVSQEQYAGIVDAVERLDQKAAALGAELAMMNSEVDALSRLLQVEPALAADILKLAVDPWFRALADEHSEAVAAVAAVRGTLGAKHPKRRKLEQAVVGTRADLIDRGAAITGLPPAALTERVELAAAEQRGDLLARLVSRKAEADGLARQHAALLAQVEADREKLRALAAVADSLDEVARDHQVAEAVFSSALARTDTNKTDMFASYPLVQTVDPPSLPVRPASPDPVLSIAAGVGASVLHLVGLALGWMRRPLIDRVFGMRDDG